MLKKVGIPNKGNDAFKKDDLFDSVMEIKKSGMHGDGIGEVCKDCVPGGDKDDEDDEDYDDDDCEDCEFNPRKYIKRRR